MIRRWTIPAFLTLFTLDGSAAAQDAQRTVNDGNVVLRGVPEIPEAIGERLRRYQNTRSARVVDWSADGGAIYIGTRFGSVSQIHRVDAPRGARTQLTFLDEPVSGVSRRPGSESILFSIDTGGSEFFQLHLLDPHSGDDVRLTDGRSRNRSGLWSDDGTLLAFTSTRRNGSSNDVYVADPTKPDEARMVFEAEDGASYSASDWSSDGQRLLVLQYVSINDSRLHLLDLSTGKHQRLAGSDEQPASFGGVTPTFDANDTRVLLSTDAFGEFKQLTALDIETGEFEVLTKDVPWDVNGLEVSADGSRAAFTVNEAGWSRLYLLDTGTWKYTLVDSIPVGLISGLRFDSRGERLAFTLNGPRTPSDVFTLDLGDSPTEFRQVERWTYSEVGGLDTSRFVEPKLIAYPTFDEVDGERRKIPAFVYEPEGAGPHPVIVSIHGGPEGQYRPRFDSNIQLWLRELGAAVIAPNVRGSAGFGKTYLKLDNGARREDSVRDIGALLDWIATQPDLDQERVAVIGGSYGGYMVLASAVHFSARLRAAVDRVGISNFVTFLENTQSYRRDLRRAEYGDERDPKMRAHLEKISPSNHADKITVPLFVVQGQNDPRVPVTEAEQIVRAVEASGHDVWYMNALNEGHGFRKKANRDLYDEATVLFFERFLLREGP